MIGFLFITAIVILSQAGTLIRFAEADSLAICFWRLLFASVVLTPLSFARRSSRDPLFRLSNSDFGYLLLTGVFLFLHFYFFFRSVQETTVANAAILFNLNPVTTAIGAYLIFKERISIHLTLACALGFAGVGFLFFESTLSSMHTPISGTNGQLWGVCSAFCFSGYILAGKHLRSRLPNLIFAWAIYLETALLAALSMMTLGIPFMGYSETTWWAFVALAILPTLLGHAIFTYCLNFMDVNFMSCMTLVEPVLAALAAHYLFKENLSAHSSAAFFLTSLSVVALYWEPILSFYKQSKFTKTGKKAA